MNKTDTEALKKAAGEKATEFVRDGMILGLGTGSTIKYFIEALAVKIREESLDITGIPTSRETEKLADHLRIPLSTLDEHPIVDLDVDGADEVDPGFNLIKGGGGAHTREKIVASASREFIVVVDDSKIVDRLGDFPVPVEILSLSKNFVVKEVQKLGGIARLREGFTTDNGNPILDARFNIINPGKLESDLNNIPGVIGNGVFSRRRPEQVVVAGDKGVKVMECD